MKIYCSVGDDDRPPLFSQHPLNEGSLHPYLGGGVVQERPTACNCSLSVSCSESRSLYRRSSSRRVSITNFPLDEFKTLYEWLPAGMQTLGFQLLVFCNQRFLCRCVWESMSYAHCTVLYVL